MTRKRVVDFALYVCIALALGCLCIVFAEHDVDSKWLALIFETCLVFGCVIAQQKQSWNRLTFWIVCLIAFAIHFVISFVVAQHVSKLRAAWVGTAFVIETVAFSALLEAVVPRFSAGQPSRTRR